jgi:octaprenyl-diphosphate synthase
MWRRSDRELRRVELRRVRRLDLGVIGVLPEIETFLPHLGARLEAVSQRFERQLQNDLPCVTMLVRHVERYRGKMLRPTLVIASGAAVQGGAAVDRTVDESLDALGAVVEMIHMATLVHDDVLDEADMRRGGDTVNNLRGNETAVMLGDFLISSSFHLCSTIGLPWLNAELGAMTMQLCSGEVLQLSHRGDLTLTQDTYFEIIRRKTGVLAGACCQLAARLSGAPSKVADSLRLYGEELGMAFQIQDDVLDLVGDEQTVGKTLGIDLRKGKLTLPVVVHLTRCTSESRARTVRAIDAGEAGTLLRLMRTTDALGAARTHALSLVASAKARLEVLPPSGPRQLLALMADATVERAF